MNTASEYDGSDSGARPDEAVSWGKITAEAKPVKVILFYFKFIIKMALTHIINWYTHHIIFNKIWFYIFILNNFFIFLLNCFWSNIFPA